MAEEQTAEDTAATPQPVIALPLGRRIGERTFHSYTEFEEWARRGRDALEWLNRNRKKEGVNHIADLNFAPFDRLLGAASNFVAAELAGNKQASTDAKSSIFTIVQKSFTNRWLLSPDDPRLTFIQKLALEDPTEAAYALGYFTRTLPTPLEVNQLVGASRAIAFEMGIDAVKGHQDALADLQREWAQIHSDLKAQVQAIQDDLAQARNERSAAGSSASLEFASAQEKREDQFQTVLEDSKRALEGFQKAYNEDLATRSAVRYWSNKAWVHRGLAAVAAVTTVGAAGLYLAFAAPAAFALLLPILANDNSPQWRVGIAIALAVLGVWMLRVLVRIFLSQLHLAADSSHRRITILSYIALLKDETNAVRDEDRSIVLANVFRPISDGIIRDDAMPPSPWELLTRPPK